MTEDLKDKYQAELDRARSDYLAVSRNAHMYATEADHAEAERRAWERLEHALEGMKQLQG